MKRLHAILERWDRRLEPFLTRCFRWKNTGSASYEAFVLQIQLAQEKRDTGFLRDELKRVRARNYELETRARNLREALAAVLGKKDEELLQTLRYDVHQAQNGGRWETVTAYCCLGGCDMGVFSFESKRDAMLFSELLNAVGYEPPSNSACSDCYAEYMKDCI